LRENPKRLIRAAEGRVATFNRLNRDLYESGLTLQAAKEFRITSTAARRMLLWVAAASGHPTATMEALDQALLAGDQAVSAWN
jgi:2-hydroxychromene-2-carboxylate isomerase